MFRTFNMGWGFAIIIEKTDIDRALSILETAGAHAEQIGNVTDRQKIEIRHAGHKLLLS
jgi:phosphoribosylaminoimidazole (AIR) synthetase